MISVSRKYVDSARFWRAFTGAVALAALMSATLALAVGEARANDYPTAARAEYVFACMASNGQTPEMLQRCSCSIDVVDSLLPYDRYVQAETIMRMRLMGGERTVVFRDAPEMNVIIEALKQAQVEADLSCF